MLFNTIQFGLFFLVVFVVYYLPGLKRLQVPILILASLVFYGWNAPGLLALLGVSIVFNSVASYAVNFSDGRKKVRWAVASVVLNLLLLAVFKYMGLLTRLSTELFGLPHNDVTHFLMVLPLPIGISFYTFEGISLLVDILRRKDDPTKAAEHPIVVPSFAQHFGNTALFIAFFPHLVAGPILKARQFYPQIGEKHFGDIDWRTVFRCLVIGYFLKTVVADNLRDSTEYLAYPIFLGQSAKTGFTLLFGYSMQIFADFAGYSLIAIGLAAALGYTLPPNFNFPYIADSLSDFWRRWHISLSTWLRDYLYFPLGGSRRGSGRTYVNLMTVMALGGLWHGAALSYMVWGIYHGLGLAVERLIFGRLDSAQAADERRSTAYAVLRGFRIVGVFVFVTLGWLLFKLPQFGHVVLFLQTMARNVHGPLDINRTAPVFLFSVPVVVYHLMKLPVARAAKAFSIPTAGFARFADAAALGLMLAVILINGGSSREFIYFQF